MKIYKQLAGQTLIYGVGTILPRVLNYLLTPLYTYILLESSFGVITEMYAYVAFIMVILTMGMETSFFKFSADKQNTHQVFSNSFFVLAVISLVFILLAILFRYPLANILGDSNYSLYIVLTAGIIFFDVITVIPLAKLRLDGKAFKFSIIRILNILINILLNLFFYLVCRNSDIEVLNKLYNPDIAVAYAFISNLAASAFNFVILLPYIFNVKLSFNKDLFLKMLHYSWPLIIVGVAGMINEVADKLFIKYLTPAHLNPMQQVGIYGANYKLAILMTIFIQVFKYAAEPFFFKQSVSENAPRIYAKVMTYFVAFCLVIFLLVALNLNVFQHFIGHNYRTGLQIVPIVLMANLCLGVYYNLSIWYKLTNKTMLGAVISLIGALLTILLSIIFIPRFGYIGAAWITLICYFSMMLISYLVGQKYYKVPYNIGTMGILIMVTLGLYFVFLLFNTQSVIMSLGYSFVSIMVLTFVLLKLERVNKASLLQLLARH